jgi:hypothetical protein
MYSDWMASLASKRTELEKKVLENWSQAQGMVEEKLWQNLKVFFEVKGLRPHIVDFMTYVEKWSPQMTREALSYFLDFFRSATLGMGLRVAKINDTQIEIVLPDRPKNLDEDGYFLESAFVTAGVESFKLLWLRHAPIGEFHFKIQKINFEKTGTALNERNFKNYRARFEIQPEQREMVLNQLRAEQRTLVDHKILFFDENEAIAAEMTLQSWISVVPSLESANTTKQ